MTPKTQPTTLQLAREYINWEKEIHYINHGYASILQHLPGIDTEREEVLRQIVKDSHAEAVAQCNRVRQAYEKRIGRTRNWNHIYNLGEIAMEYAWK